MSEPDPFVLPYPDHMTEGGARALREHVEALYRPIVTELEKRAAEQRTVHGVLPELTARDVGEAVADLARRRRTGPGSGPDTLGRIAMSVASVGVGATTPFLHSPWQWALFAALCAVGAVGLAGTWIARPIGRHRPRRRRS